MDDTDRLRSLLARAAEPPGGPVAVSAARLAARARHTWRRRRLVAVSGVAIATVLAVLVAGTLVRGTPDDDEPVPLTAPQIAQGRWSALPAAPVPARAGAATVWTGSLMLAWGGAAGPRQDQLRDDGVSFDPSTDEWRVLPPAPLSARTRAAAVWTGREMFVWGGLDRLGPSPGLARTGALYHPGTRSWRRTPPAPLAPAWDLQAYWTGSRVLVVTLPDGGQGDGSGLHGALYDPVGDRWTGLPAPPRQPSPRTAFRAFTALVGPELYMWTLWAVTETRGDTVTGAAGAELRVLDLRAGTWSTSTTWPRDRGLSRPVWTGRALLMPTADPVRHPSSSGPISPRARGALWDPTTGAWRQIARGPADDLGPQSVWTGAALLSVNTTTSIVSQGSGETHRPGEAAVWDPATDTWASLPPAPLAGGENGSTMWTGRELLVWGWLYPPPIPTLQSSGDVGPPRSAGLRFTVPAPP